MSIYHRSRDDTERLSSKATARYLKFDEFIKPYPPISTDVSYGSTRRRWQLHATYAHEEYSETVVARTYTANPAPRKWNVY